MKKPEILCPAGDQLSFKAALLGGCDAIYLGGYTFGARAFSKNFSNEEISVLVDYAHAYGVKVYVTVNTLIYENEVKTFLNYIDFLHKSHVDAVIVQDIGMADLIHQVYPNLEIHASTQMHIHNIEGVKFAEKLGMKRVVLARETPIELVKDIKANSNLELEIFVHGALCVSYSGQCLMSSLIGGRSGNRGTCAGSCRQRYDVLNEKMEKVNVDEYNLSTKDLNTLEHIGELIDVGVDSLKIEGRMKSPAYVYLVTKLYREAVDSYFETGKVHIDKEKLKNLMKTFNRMYTKGFLFNEQNNNYINPYRPNHQGIEIGRIQTVMEDRVVVKLYDDLNLNDGIRFIGEDDDGLTVTKMSINGKYVDHATKGDIVHIYTNKKAEKGGKVLKTVYSLLTKEIEDILEKTKRKIPISGKIRVCVGEKMQISVTDGKYTSFVESSKVVEEAKNCPITKEEIEKRVYKTGETAFRIENLEIECDNKGFVPVHDLNELRREAVEKMLDLRVKPFEAPYVKLNYNRSVNEYKDGKIKSVYVQNLSQLEKVKKMPFNRFYLDEEEFNKNAENELIIMHIPRVIEHHKEYSNNLLVGELGSVNKYKNIVSDFSLNVVNSYSVALLHSLGVKRVTLSYELNDKQINDLIDAYKKRYHSNPNLALIVYGREEMMISKFNLLKYYNLSNKAYLRDKFSNLYELRSKDNLMYIYNRKPRILDNPYRYFDMGINEIRFNVLSDNEIDEISKI